MQWNIKYNPLIYAQVVQKSFDASTLNLIWKNVHFMNWCPYCYPLNVIHVPFSRETPVWIGVHDAVSGVNNGDSVG